ncbi:glycosyltransferase [candidate division TA06 bacterium]|uniref:Glycosyltransferase n=1 Tax=candidate division TA06 bacterium TaxID=2250710 RepID=A0A523UN27_UNCT6|nr:MAG: glycosyltransferase [candidate division TA06 bacterium]
MPKRRFGPLSLLSLVFRLPKAALRLKHIHDSIGIYEAMLVGYPGDWANYLVIPLGKLLSGRRKVPLILDQFISLHESYVHDKGMIREGSLLALCCRITDHMSSRFASLVLLDTEEHISLFRQRLDLTVTEFRRIFVGTDEDVFYPRKSEGKTSQFTVLFYGSMIPLQGVEFIIRAGALLRDEQIEFKIIGPRASTGFAQARTLADQLKADNIRFQDGLPYGTLPDLIAEADICLGIFGTTEKAKSVIPNKAFEAIAMAKPLITGDSPAAREVFTSGQNVLLCQMGSPKALADAIRTLMNDDALRQNIAKAGYKLFTEKFTTERIGAEVLKCISEAMSKVQKSMPVPNADMASRPAN